MSDVNDVLGDAGGGEQVESLGEVWTLHHVTPGVRAKFGAWCKTRARREAQGDAALAAAFLEQCVAGAYGWGSPLDPRGAGSAVRAALSQQEGNVQLVRLLMDPRQSAGLDDGRLVEVVEGNAEGFAAAVAECLKATAGPNGKAPPTGGATKTMAGG